MSASSVLASIARQPSLAYYYAQKGVRSLGVRNVLGAAVAGMVAARAGSTARDCGAAQAAHTLQESGICFLPQLDLGPQQLAHIRASLRGKPVFDWYGSQHAYDIDQHVPPEQVKLGYRTSDLLACEPLLRLANSPLILDAVTQVLGARPTISWFESWWTLGEHHAPGRTYFDDVYHRDVDDLRFVKLFVYLTDTGLANGAHSFVRGSHRDAALTRRGPISDEEVRAVFPAQDILTITGKAGTVFLENTWGIHRPLLATEGRRLIFSALYSLTPWVPRGPNAGGAGAMPPGLDPYVNRALFSRA